MCFTGYKELVISGYNNCNFVIQDNGVTEQPSSSRDIPPPDLDSSTTHQERPQDTTICEDTTDNRIETLPAVPGVSQVP